jgi:hypothetical protein
MQVLTGTIAELRQVCELVDQQKASIAPDSCAMYALQSAQAILKERFLDLQRKHTELERKHEQTVSAMVCMIMDYFCIDVEIGSKIRWHLACIFTSSNRTDCV